MSEMPFITAYGKKQRVRTDTSGPSRTKQAFKDECDINKILARFTKTGVINFTQQNEPRYGDCTGMEYTAAMNKVAAARSLFNEMPAELRARFDNEPALFLDFVNDEKNREEAQALGLLKKGPEKPVVTSAPAAAPTPAPASPAAPAAPPAAP